MDREGVEDPFRVMRAIRSLAYNRELQPLVEGRIERAEVKIRGFLMLRGEQTARIGQYEVVMDEEGRIALSQLRVDYEWQQLTLNRADGVRLTNGA